MANCWMKRHQTILISHHPELVGNAGEESVDISRARQPCIIDRIGPLRIPEGISARKRSLGGGSWLIERISFAFSEGKKGRRRRSLHQFAHSKLKPSCIRPFKGSNLLRPIDCGGRDELIARMPQELTACSGEWRGYDFDGLGRSRRRHGKRRSTESEILRDRQNGESYSRAVRSRRFYLRKISTGELDRVLQRRAAENCQGLESKTIVRWQMPPRRWPNDANSANRSAASDIPGMVLQELAQNWSSE